MHAKLALSFRESLGLLEQPTRLGQLTRNQFGQRGRVSRQPLKPGSGLSKACGVFHYFPDVFTGFLDLAFGKHDRGLL